MSRPQYHDEKDRNRLFRNTLKDPINGVRDHAILRLLYGTPLRSIEQAKLKTHDLVNDQGHVTNENYILLRSEVSFNGKQRPIPLNNPILKDSLQRWVDFRLEEGWGVTPTGFLDLEMPFFLRNPTEGFKVITTHSGGKARRNVDNFNRVVRARMKANELDGSVESGLRTWTLDRHREERALERIWAYRGDADIETVRRVIANDPVRLGALVEQVY